MRVLVWNLFHGRADPPAGRPLLREFAAALAGWEWDVALLQEVPPWWAPLLAGHCDADVRTALTSRNQLLPLRRAIASRAPDRLKSNGGGANAILVRAPWTITAHGRRRLRLRPERRVVHAVRVEIRGGRPTSGSRHAVVTHSGRAPVDPTPGGGPDSSARDPFDGAWLGNVHAQLGSWDSPAGMIAPRADLDQAIAQMETWERTVRPAADREPRATVSASPVSTAPPVAADRDGHRCGASAVVPLVLGGDLNLPRDAVDTGLPADWIRVASSGPDHVVGHGIHAVAPSRRPDRGTLSDHAPLLVDVVVR